MKICHLTSAHKSNDVRIFEKECVSLAKRKDNEVFLVAQGESYYNKNVNIIGIGMQSGNRLTRFLSVSKKIYRRAIEIDADVYHIHDPELLLYVHKLKKKGKKVIFDCHEHYRKQIVNKNYIPKIFRNIVASIYSQYEDYVCKFLDAVIFPCPIEGKHPFEGKVPLCEYIDNVPILNDIELNKERKSYNVVCCVGTLSRERGIETLVDACYMAGVKLILAGKIIPKEFEEHLINKKEFSVVEYRGICSREEVAEIYKDAFIGTSNIFHTGQYDYATNLPTKVYEYMMHAMPFLITDTDFFKNVVNEYKCGMTIVPDNAYDIADKILYLINHKDLAIQMGQNGYALIRQKFNWSKEEEKLYQLYNMVNCL